MSTKARRRIKTPCACGHALNPEVYRDGGYSGGCPKCDRPVEFEDAAHPAPDPIRRRTRGIGGQEGD
jgi:hypothetical protein